MYEKALNLPLLGKLENKFLFGWDQMHIDKKEIKYDQIPDYGGDNSIKLDALNPLKP